MSTLAAALARLSSAGRDPSTAPGSLFSGPYDVTLRNSETTDGKLTARRRCWLGGLAFLHQFVGMAVDEPPSIAFQPERLADAQFHKGCGLAIAASQEGSDMYRSRVMHCADLRMSCNRALRQRLPFRRSPVGPDTHTGLEQRDGLRPRRRDSCYP
jgi:hypothetical protein